MTKRQIEHINKLFGVRLAVRNIVHFELILRRREYVRQANDIQAYVSNNFLCIFLTTSFAFTSQSVCRHTLTYIFLLSMSRCFTLWCSGFAATQLRWHIFIFSYVSRFTLPFCSSSHFSHTFNPWGHYHAIGF